MIERVIAFGGAAVTLVLASCGPVRPTIESAEFVCDGSTPNLSVKVTGADKDSEGGLLSTSVSDSEGKTSHVDLLRTVSSQTLRLESFNYGPNPQPFQPETYTVRAVARTGTSSGALVTTAIFDASSATLTEGKCSQ